MRRSRPREEEEENIYFLKGGICFVSFERETIAGCHRREKEVSKNKLTREACRAPAGKSADWMDGSEEESRAADEIGCVAEFQDGQTFFEVEARLPHAQRIIKGQHLKSYFDSIEKKEKKKKKKNRRSTQTLILMGTNQVVRLLHTWRVVNLVKAWRRR